MMAQRVAPLTVARRGRRRSWRTRSALARLCPLLLALTSLLFVSACSSTDDREVPVLPGLETHLVDEPVFGGQVHIYEAGNPAHPTVVLVHGIDREGAASWRQLIDTLRADYHVLALDLPGFGHSSGGNHFYSPDHYTEVLAHVIDDFGDGPVHLVGHSLGGAVALRYADAYPQTVEHLYVASVAGILHKASYTGFTARRGDIDQEDGDHAEGWVSRLYGRLLDKFFRRTEGGPNLAESERSRRYLLGGEPDRIAAVALLETDFSETLEDFPVPVSIAWGARDRIAPLRTGRLLAGVLPGRDLTVFPRSAHAPMLDNPDDFAQFLITRLAGEDVGADAWPPPPAEPGDRIGRCEDDIGATFHGAYDRIEVVNCRQVLFDRVTAHHIHIERSRATLREPRLAGDAFGLRIIGSDVTVTAGHISGDVAIDVTQSFLDVAGTRLEGRDAAVYASGRGGGELTFSVTPYVSGDDSGFLHEIRAFHHENRI